MSQVIWLATAAGARLICQQSKWAVLVSAALIVGAVYAALQQDFLSITLSAIVVAYIGILIFGFLMQAGLLFQPVRVPARRRRTVHYESLHTLAQLNAYATRGDFKQPDILVVALMANLPGDS